MSLHDALWWALAGGIAALAAVLLWMVVTPVSPLGAWRPAEVRVMSPAARAALFAQVDPFNRAAPAAAGAGASTVTGLALTLFGVRVNAATGGGSAIIAGADGIQQVYRTGTEVMPGVLLAEVHFDHVGLSRNGATELLYLDQSKPAPAASTVLAQTPAGLVGGSTASVAPLTVQGLRQGIALQPQATDNGRVNGLQVSADGDGAAFRAAGFQPGDVIVGVGGKPVANPSDGVTLLNSLRPGGSVAVTVQRGGKQLPLAITVSP
ncbi:MAG TPA: type II secretion system protein N [Novosphingobium sp.]|nr:type II secretion system protein N [Novosphingobium sp.]